MKKKVVILAFTACFICACFLTTNLFAQAWVGDAKRLFENDEYQKVISVTENIKKNNFAAMFLAFSHLQESIFNETKYDREKFKAYKMMLEAKLGINDIDNLLYFVNLNYKPMVVKEARKLTKKTFKGIKNIENIPQLLPFLNSSDLKSRKMTLTTIKKILEPKRKYVIKQGGTLRPKDVRIMSSKNLISALLENINESDARKSLELIEEPVLEYIPSFGGTATAKLETKINKNIAKRKKKYPESNWYSATGETR